jgi:hypothetical protein
MKYTAPIVVALVLVAAGCGERESEVPAVPSPTAQDSMQKPPQDSMESVPKAPAPPPDPAPTGNAAELPKPGQNNDHSSPAFNKGGASEPQK